MYTKTDYDITVVVNFDGGVRTVHQDSQFFSQGVKRKSVIIACFNIPGIETTYCTDVRRYRAL